MLKMEKKALITVALIVMAMAASVFAGTVTVATFDDPSAGSAENLFTVNYSTGIIEGGWAGAGLTLDVPVAGGASYDNVTFELDPLAFSSTPNGNFTGIGSIRFMSGGVEVLNIAFDQLHIQGRNSGLDAQDVYGDNVTITGLGVPVGLTQESFGFSFTNAIDDHGIVAATASFTSSAVPEPATMALLALGGLIIRKRK